MRSHLSRYSSRSEPVTDKRYFARRRAMTIEIGRSPSFERAGLIDQRVIQIHEKQSHHTNLPTVGLGPRGPSRERIALAAVRPPRYTRNRTEAEFGRTGRLPVM